MCWLLIIHLVLAFVNWWRIIVCDHTFVIKGSCSQELALWIFKFIDLGWKLLIIPYNLVVSFFERGPFHNWHELISSSLLFSLPIYLDVYKAIIGLLIHALSAFWSVIAFGFTSAHVILCFNKRNRFCLLILSMPWLSAAQSSSIIFLSSNGSMFGRRILAIFVWSLSYSFRPT